MARPPCRTVIFSLIASRVAAPAGALLVSEVGFNASFARCSCLQAGEREIRLDGFLAGCARVSASALRTSGRRGERPPAYPLAPAQYLRWRRYDPIAVHSF